MKIIGRSPDDPSGGWPKSLLWYDKGTVFKPAYSKLISSVTFSAPMDKTKQAELAQWLELQTAATSDNTKTITVLLCEDEHRHSNVLCSL